MVSVLLCLCTSCCQKCEGQGLRGVLGVPVNFGCLRMCASWDPERSDIIRSLDGPQASVCLHLVFLPQECLPNS
uniref:Secreted protein n=1 Tax=Anguilla anguilla TaxID=7936 RepID=A0A0E9WBU9_ANGAN